MVCCWCCAIHILSHSRFIFKRVTLCLDVFFSLREEKTGLLFFDVKAIFLIQKNFIRLSNQLHPTSTPAWSLTVPVRRSILLTTHTLHVLLPPRDPNTDTKMALSLPRPPWLQQRKKPGVLCCICRWLFELCVARVF